MLAIAYPEKKTVGGALPALPVSSLTDELRLENGLSLS